MGWFEGKLQELQFIDQLKIESSDGFAPTAERPFRRILLLSAIDSFAWIAKQHFKWALQKPGEVFQSFVVKFGGWDHAEHISAAVVANPRHPKHVKVCCSDSIRKIAADRLPPLDSNATCNLDIDFGPAEYPELARLSHAKLLWDYRNTVLHEFHADPFWCEFAGRDDRDAHYANVMGVEDRVWKPCYPSGFLARLALDSLKALRKAMQD